MSRQRKMRTREMIQYLLELTCVSNYDEIPKVIKWGEKSFEAWDKALVTNDGLNIASLYMFSLNRLAIEVFDKDPLEAVANSDPDYNGKPFEAYRYNVTFDEEGQISSFYIINGKQEVPDTVESLLKVLAIFKNEHARQSMDKKMSYDKESGTLDVTPMTNELVSFLLKDNVVEYLISECGGTFSGKDMYVCPLSGTQLLHKSKLNEAILTASKLPEDLSITEQESRELF